jgi:hypothetical protein
MRPKLPLLYILLALVALPAVAETLRGELTARYRDRWGSTAWEDQDIFTYLRLSYGEKSERGISGALSLRWDVDLLTRANEIDDGNDDLRFYYAYVDVKKIDNLDLRLGRQYLDEAEGFHLTGVKGIYSAPWRNLRVGLFAGQPVSFYSAVHGDERAGGLTWSLRPGERAQLRGSWIHLEEEASDNDVVTVSYRRGFGQGSNLYLTARTLDFEVFNELVGGSWQIQPLDVLLSGSYRRQEDTNASRSTYFGDLSTIIGPSRPYQQLNLNLSRPLSDLATVGVGFTRRELLGAAENRGNQEFDRYFLDVFLTEQALRGFAANANFSRWETDRDDSSTLSGSLSRRFGDHLKVELGSVYAKYDLRRVFDAREEIPRERFDARTNYLRGEWRVRKQYRVRLDLDRTIDSTSDDAYWEAELRLGLDLGLFTRGRAQ